MFSGSGVRVPSRRTAPHPDRHVLCTPGSAHADTVARREHDLRPDELSDELAVLIAEELDDRRPGQPEFELVFTGIVHSTVDGAMPAWLRFYRNSLDRLEDGVAAFARCEHAASLLVSSRVVDLGSCSGSCRCGLPPPEWTW